MEVLSTSAAASVAWAGRDGDEAGNNREEGVGKEHSEEVPGKTSLGWADATKAASSTSAAAGALFQRPHRSPCFILSGIIPCLSTHLLFYLCRSSTSWSSKVSSPCVETFETETADWGIEHVNSEATLPGLKSQLST